MIPIKEEKIDLSNLSDKEEEEEFQKPTVKMPFYGVRFMMADSTPTPQAQAETSNILSSLMNS